MGEETSTHASNTLADIQRLYETKGAQAATSAFQDVAPKSIFSSHKVIRRTEGSPSLRIDILDTDAITYANFSPPALWGEPFSLLKMTLYPTPKADSFVTHAGEELLYPTAGTVRYIFYWGKEKSSRQSIQEDFQKGILARINPAIPHHGWAAEDEKAEAWLLLFHDPNSSAAFDLEARFRSSKVLNTRRRFALKELDDPGHYALAAWGISDRIRTQRQRANLTIAQLAELVQIDPSHLSRIENSSTNVSIDAIVQLCRFLRIDLGALVTSADWHAERSSLENFSEMCMACPGEKRHFLHPRTIDFKATQYGNSVNAKIEDGLTTWVVLRGKMVIDIQGNVTDSELLDEGTVVHFRRNAELQVQTLSDARILEIVLSPHCPKKIAK